MRDKFFKVGIVLRFAQRFVISVGQVLRNGVPAVGILCIMAGHFLVFAAPAGAGFLSGLRLDREGDMFTPVIKARVICQVYREGTALVTEWCKDGYTCDNHRCLPGPDLQRLGNAAEKLKQALDERMKQLEKMQKELERDQRKSTPAAASQPASAGVMQQSGSCSTITGLGGGGSGPSNCTPSTGVPANIQAQIDQARASMQAARTVQQSDPSTSAQTAAAAQFRNAAAAFERAGDLAQAAVATDQAQAIENALSSNLGQSATAPSVASAVNPQAVPAGDQANAAPSGDQCPPVIPASYWQNGPNADYCAKASASCVERGAALYGYLCASDAPTAADTPDAGLEERLRGRLKRTRPASYKPPISPQALRALAFTNCGDKSLADRPRCIEDYELSILLGADAVVGAACASIAESIARHNQAVDAGPGPDWLKAARQWVCAPDPDVRAECGSIQNREAQAACVDAVYVRGPGAYGNRLRSTLRNSLQAPPQ